MVVLVFSALLLIVLRLGYLYWPTWHTTEGYLQMPAALLGLIIGMTIGIIGMTIGAKVPHRLGGNRFIPYVTWMLLLIFLVPIYHYSGKFELTREWKYLLPVMLCILAMGMIFGATGIG
jgi:hypothetical protein